MQLSESQALHMPLENPPAWNVGEERKGKKKKFICEHEMGEILPRKSKVH